MLRKTNWIIALLAAIAVVPAISWAQTAPKKTNSRKIVVERPLLDDSGKPVLKKGKPVPDAARRDTENVPLTEDIDEYFAR